MTKTFVLLFIATLPVWLTSCLDAECVDKTKVYMKVSFYDYERKVIASPDSVTLFGADSEVKIYDNQKGITPPALLPLKGWDSETEFIITINGTIDTVRFVHSNSPHLISKECGYSMYHTLDTIYYTTNEIDSISLTNREVTLRNIENVAIFY